MKASVFKLASHLKSDRNWLKQVKQHSTVFHNLNIFLNENFTIVPWKWHDLLNTNNKA